MQRSKSKLKKDDKVKVITGKDKGKIGKVLKVDRKNERILATSFGFVELMMIPTCVFVEARRSLMCFPA